MLGIANENGLAPGAGAGSGAAYVEPETGTVVPNRGELLDCGDCPDADGAARGFRRGGRDIVDVARNLRGARGDWLTFSVRLAVEPETS